MATHSSTVWKIPLTWEPGMLQSMRAQRVGHNWVHAHTYINVKGKTVPIWEKRRGLLTAVPNFFSTRDWFHERPSFHRPGLEGWFQGDSSPLHLLCTFFLLLLHQLHIRSSGIRSQRLGTLVLKSYMGTFLVVQWIRLCTLNAGGPGSIPSQGARSRMPQLKT